MLELIRANQINTATQLVVNSNTASAANVYLSDVRYQASSSGMADDSQWYTMRVNFGATTLVDRIAIREHNAREFRMYYNGATASIFSLTDANTATLDFLNNTDVNQYFRIPPTYVTSLTLEMRATMTADQNKAIGYLYAGDALTDFDGYVPPAEGYDPVLKDISVVHIMSDGGKRIHSIADRWSASLRFTHLPQQVRDELKEIFDNHSDMVFSAFGTATGWDGHLFPCVWEGPFGFYRYSDNAATSGYSGTLELAETSF